MTITVGCLCGKVRYRIDGNRSRRGYVGAATASISGPGAAR